MSKNAELASVLESIARMLDVLGEDSFKSIAHTRAARAIEALPTDICTMSKEEILALEGIDDHERQQLDSYQPWHAARADLLARAGRPAEAVEAYDRAIALTASDAERRFLTARRQACRTGQTPP